MVFAERLRRRHADRKDPSAWQKVKIVAAQQVCPAVREGRPPTSAAKSPRGVRSTQLLREVRIQMPPREQGSKAAKVSRGEFICRSFFDARPRSARPLQHR